MRRLHGLVLAAGVLAVAACAQSINTDYDPSVQFARYRTFALVSRPDSASHELVDDRVREAVAEELGRRGLTRADRRQADLFVGYGVVDHTHSEVYSDKWPWGASWGWRYYHYGVPLPMDTRPEISRWTDGTVVVTLVDARTRRVVWRGQADDVLRLPVDNPDRARTQIAEAVNRIFSKFPPASRA